MIKASRWQQIRSRMGHNPLAPQQGRRGIALILAITSLMFMVYIATEVTHDSAVEYIVNSQELNRLKAYYAARNSMQIALLRIKLYEQATQMSLPEAFASQIDQIWKFPFSWPLPVPSDLNSVDKDTMSEVSSKSLMDATYTHTIEDEGSKIDINDLASPSKVLREITKKQILNIFTQKLDTDDNFRNNYQSTNFEDLVNKIYDWMSDSNEAASGGDKKSEFSALGEGYPPNRGFRTLEELRLVPGMTDEFYDLLAPRVTIYGMKAINPNTASKEVLMSLDPGLTEQAVNEAIERRDNPDKGGPFKGRTSQECLNDFKSVVERGSRLSPDFDQIPMICNKVINFRIKAIGIYGSGKLAVQRTITAVVMDISASAKQIKGFVDKENTPPQNPANPANPATPAQGNPAGPTAGNQTQEPLPKGPPRVVYWTEN